MYELLKSLGEANVIVQGERIDDYGKPEMSFDKIARYWSVYLGAPIYPKDVASMMELLKIARGNKKRDNWIDRIGYAAIGADMLDE